MSSDQIVKWTAIFTNIAVVVGLVFVGLEFRSNTRTVEAERIDSFTQGSLELHKLSVEDAELTEILLQAYENAESLTKNDRDRAQHWMVINYLNFRRIKEAHEAGVLPDDVYETEKAGIGFVFSSDIGQEVIESFTSSSLLNTAWDDIRESAESARVHCLEPENRCLDRYKTPRNGNN